MVLEQGMDASKEGRLRERVGDVLKPAVASGRSLERLLPRLLAALRTHLGLNVGFISRFRQGAREFLYVDHDGDTPAPIPGDSDPLDQSTCLRVATARAPNLVFDAATDTSLSDLAVVGELGIRTHASVPIPFGTNGVFGTLCCYSLGETRLLDDRDIGFMSAVADIIGSALEEDHQAESSLAQRRKRIREILASGDLRMVWQPVVDAHTRKVLAVESLARFNARSFRPPNEWFDEAVELGIGSELERVAFAKGCDILADLPDGISVTCNVSGETLTDPAFQSFLDEQELSNVVIEITEHDMISDYRAVSAVLEKFRAKGARLAVDDFGAGYASFRHILELNPDIIKLDMSMVRDIDKNERAQNVVAGLMQFAREDATRVVAEGVETEAELRTLKGLGIQRIQGYVMHKPLEYQALMTLLR